MAGRKSGKWTGKEKEERRATFFAAESGERRVSATSPNRNMNAADPSENLEVPLKESHGNGTSRKRLREINANGSKKGNTEDPAAYKSAARNLEGTKVAGKVQRQQAVISQRWPISEGEKKYTLQSAEKFISKYPSTLQVMKATCVYKSFFMIIPTKFVRKHLPHTSKKLTLWDPEGKTWEVEYVYCSHRSAGAFSGGWSKFSLGNHLEESDVCVFELFTEDNINVHIYRANPFLTKYRTKRS